MGVTQVGALGGGAIAYNYQTAVYSQPLPAGCQPGDLAVLFSSTAASPSNGAVYGPADGGWTAMSYASDGSFVGGTHRKILTPADITAGAINVRGGQTNNSQAGCAAQVQVWRGPSIATDGVVASSVYVNAVPNLTTTRTGDQLLLFLGSGGNAGNSGSFLQMPSGYTQDVNYTDGGRQISASAHRTALTGAPGAYGGEQLPNGYSNFMFVVALTSNLAPNAPTLTNPTAPGTGKVNRLAWTASDPDTGDAQTAWEVEYRANGTTRAVSVTSASVGSSAGTQAYWDAPAGTFYGPVQWRARTADASSFGDWSTWSTFTCPVVAGTSGSPEGSSAQGQFHDPAITPAIAALYGLTGSPTQTPARTGSLLGRLRAALAGALDQPGGAAATSSTTTVSVVSGGAWTQVSVSASKALVTSVRLATDETSAGVARLVRFDLGVGAVGSEVAIATVWLSALTFSGWVRLPAPVLVNAGERLSVRLAPLDATRSLSVRSTPL